MNGEKNARRANKDMDNRRSGFDGGQDVQPTTPNEVCASQPDNQGSVSGGAGEGQSGAGTETQAQGLTFDEASHTYAMNGRPIPGVTSIIQNVGLTDFHADVTEAMERGRAVHMICELYDRCELAADKVPSDLEGYLEAWIKFRIEANVSKIEWQGDDKMSEIFGYAGRIDRLVSFRDHPTEYVLDIKTGAAAAWHRIQTAAYEQLRGTRNPIRYCVYLSPHGNFKLVQHDNYCEDANVFNAALIVQSWKENSR